MLAHPTQERLTPLGLTGMAKAFDEQRRQPDIAVLSFEERLALLLDREAMERENMRQIPVEDMFTRKGTLRADGLMVHDLYLARVKKPSEQRYPWDFLEILATIPGEVAFPRLEDEGCSLVGTRSQ